MWWEEGLASCDTRAFREEGIRSRWAASYSGTYVDPHSCLISDDSPSRLPLLKSLSCPKGLPRLSSVCNFRCRRLTMQLPTPFRHRQGRKLTSSVTFTLFSGTWKLVFCFVSPWAHYGPSFLTWESFRYSCPLPGHRKFCRTIPEVLLFLQPPSENRHDMPLPLSDPEHLGFCIHSTHSQHSLA